MRKTLVAVAVTVLGTLGMSATAQAQEDLPPCPPGTSNPGYCEAQPPCPDGAANPDYCEVGPTKATKLSVKSAVRQAHRKVRKRGRMLALLRRKRMPFLAGARSAGVYRMRLVVRSCGQLIVVARGAERVSERGRVVLALRVTKAGHAYLLRKTYLLGLRPGARRPRPRNACERRSGNRRQHLPRMALAMRFKPQDGLGHTERKRVIVR